jgi:hypothetical protein
MAIRMQRVVCPACGHGHTFCMRAGETMACEPERLWLRWRAVRFRAEAASLSPKGNDHGYT